MPEPLRILVIDNDPVMREALTSALGGEHAMQYAESGAQGIETARAFQPDMILLDIELPDIDGYEVCRQLRDLEDRHDWHVALLSEHDTLDNRLRVYECGGHDFIVKPVECDELLCKVDIVSQSLADRRQQK